MWRHSEKQPEKVRRNPWHDYADLPFGNDERLTAKLNKNQKEGGRSGNCLDSHGEILKGALSKEVAEPFACLEKKSTCSALYGPGPGEGGARAARGLGRSLC